MDFYSAYARGFVRVAACTHRTVLADPAANAESVLDLNCLIVIGLAGGESGPR